MRPVRFVALSEDGQAFVLADEVGRLLALPIDERIHTVLRHEPGTPGHTVPTPEPVTLSPRDIQAKIRSGESADEVARAAGVPVDRVLRYAGPVLQERAMLAQHARRTKLRGSDKGASLAEVVDARLAQHGVDAEKISWDAYRRDDGTWRIVATWPSGKATAQAAWELDRARQAVAPHDDMARYLCTERAQPAISQEPLSDRQGRGIGVPHRTDTGRAELPGRGEMPGHGRGDGGRGGHEPMRAPTHDQARRDSRPTGRPADPIRSGRDALLASLERPLGAPVEPAARSTEQAPPRSGGLAARPASPEPVRPAARQGNLLGGPGSAFDDDVDAPKEVPAVPSLAVLRPRRNGAAAAAAAAAEPAAPAGEKRKRLPSWDDVLFGSAPARESS